jgi:hypothetical protein
MIVRSKFFYDSNADYTAEALQEGLKLDQIVTAHASDEAAMEAAVKKAGFNQDSLGNWFITKGTLQTFDKLTGENKTGPNVIHVPTPVSLTAGLSRASQRRHETIPAF